MVVHMFADVSILRGQGNVITIRSGAHGKQESSSCNKFFEMDTVCEKTFCCGGGGGVLTDEVVEVRVKGAMPRMQEYKKVVDAHGVNFFALICAICKAQFTKVFPYYGFEMEEVGGVHQLVSNALVMGAKEGV